MTRLALVLALLAGFALPAVSQTAEDRDPVAPLLARIEQALSSGSIDRYLDLLATSANRQSASAFAQTMVAPGVTRAVLRERDRLPLLGVLPGDGYSLLVEAFLESGSRARLSTWRLDVRRRASGPPGDWGVVSQEALTTLHGLFRLTLNTKRQVSVKELVISAEDLKLTVPEGSLFFAENEDGPTAVVVLGRGEMTFSPAPAAERSQLRLLTGAETLQTGFEGVFLRVNPSDFRARVDAREMTERPVDPRDFKRADEIFRQELPKSFGLSLGDLSGETWSLLPSAGDVLAEIRTRRFETLTYTKSASEVEDISVYNRKARRNVSVYSSRDHLRRYTRFYSEDEKADIIVHSYDLAVAFSPGDERLDGRANLVIEAVAPSMSTFTLKLADSLNVLGVVSQEFGRLLCVRIRDQDSLVVNLPATLVRGYRLHLQVVYSGQLQPQEIDRESVELQIPQERQVDEFEMPLEDSFLFSNRSYWYPQPPVLNYAPADIRVTVDDPWVAVASGRLLSASVAPGPVERVRRSEFTFSAERPVRYLTLLFARLTEVKREKVELRRPGEAEKDGTRGAERAQEVELRVTANQRQKGAARELAKSAASILKFYASLIGEFPYPTFTVAAVERKLPGGHSPAYLGVIGVPGLLSNLRWSDDPGALPFPEFFIAHELAHQWWGQAVGWKNYHEQWLSEGFAQYFSALYAEKSRGRQAFDAILRRMQNFALEDSDQGPVYLGYRIGHAKGDSRLFRAVVYNKGAMVLHTLRRLVGDEAFFNGLRLFYSDWRFKKAGTDDLRKAMEKASGRDLRRFFDLWVLGETIPQVSFGWKVEPGATGSDVLVRLEQAGEVFDVPLTVTLEFEDGSTSDTVASLVDKTLELRIPAAKKVRRVDVNRDRAAVAVVRAVAGSGQ